MIERRAALLRYIQARWEVSTRQLFGQFPDYTPKTVRRYLAHWEQAGAILRSHGKARVNPQYLFQLETRYSEREEANAQIKDKLSAAAVGLLGECHSLFIDSGTTMMALARRLPDKNLTILTAAPNIALAIAAGSPQCSVLLTGGGLNPKTLSCSGYGSAELVKLINLEVAFMATSGFSIAGGFTVGEHFECDLKRMVIARAERVILVMDRSKVVVSMPFTFARPGEIDVLVCDGLDAETENHLLSKGVEIIKS